MMNKEIEGVIFKITCAYFSSHFVNKALNNGPFPFYMKFEKIQNRQKYHHSLKEHPMFSKTAKFGCEML